MAAQLDHTIVWCRDKHRSSAFMAEMLGLPEPVAFLHFMVVRLANGVSMDFMERDGDIGSQHYAFLVDDIVFDESLAKIVAKRLAYWADPSRSSPGTINRHWGGRGVYFDDPDGHLLELITKTYGSENDL